MRVRGAGQIVIGLMRQRRATAFEVGRQTPAVDSGAGVGALALSRSYNLVFAHAGDEVKVFLGKVDAGGRPFIGLLSMERLSGRIPG